MAERIETDLIVRAIAEGFDKMGGVLGETATEVKKLEETTQRGAKGLLAFRGANQDAAGAARAFGIDLTALSNPLTLTATLTKAALDKTMQWGDTIDELTRITGESAEEASKMAIVLNDWGVSTDSLKGAAKALKDEGLTPSLSTLKALAAEYQTLPEGAARTEWGTKKLGRAYFELSEVLTKTPEQFDEMTRAAAASGKIMDEAGIQKAEDFAIKTKQLGDVTDGLAITIGSTLIPMLNEAGTALHTLLTWDAQVQAALDEHAQEVALTTQSYAEYRDELVRANEAAGKHTSSLDAMGRMVVTGIDNTNILTEAEWEHTRALEANQTAMASVGDERAENITILGGMITKTGEAAQAERDLNQALKDLQLEISGPVGKANEDFIRQQADLRLEMIGAQTEIDNLTAKSGKNVTVVTAATASSAELQLAQIKATESSIKLAEAQLTLSENTDVDKQEALNKKVLEAQVAFEGASGKVADLGGKMGDTQTYTTDYSTAIGEQKQKLEDLQTAYADNATAHEEATKRIIFDMLTQRAAVDGLSDAELDFLNDTALKWGLVDQATHDAVEAIDLALGDLATGNIKDAQAAVDDLVGHIDKIPRTVNVDINVATRGAAGEAGIGPEGGGPAPGSETRPTSGGFQHGGSFIIPGTGAGDRPVTFMGAPGERVDVTPRGGGRGSSAGSGANMDYMMRAFETRIVRAFRDALQLAR